MEIGRSIAGYVVEARLGAGAMATVYRVRRGDGALFALKVLDAATLERRRRFLREARSQARLDHPNVVGIEGELEVDGLPALLLEYVAGPSLGRVIAERPPPLSAADSLARGLLAGAAAAHAAGLVHRDIKPDNVLVAVEGGRIEAKLTDFGVAKGDADGEGTRTGGLLGTPAYMAPEQIRAPGEVDARADVFSLGAVLYELCTGRRAFGGRSTADVLDAILAGPRPAGPAGLPPRMVRAIEAALAPDPDDRPADAAALGALWAGGEEALLPDPAWVAGLPVAGAGPVRLPATPDPFVGRAAEIEAVTDALAAERWITLWGTGGAGKTRLAVEVARRVAERFEGGVWFVDLAPVRDADGALSAVSAALDLPLGANPAERIGRALAARSACLLVLDNAEQVTEAVGPLAEGWLGQAPGLAVLTTSRAALGGAGERVLPVGGLREEDAVALFVARGLRARADSGVDAEGAELAALVRELDALPLAIELAAARLRSTTPARLLERMSDRFRVLRDRRPDVPERQRTLEATLQWSWELLEPWERSAAAQLSVFVGAWSDEEAAAVVRLDPGSPPVGEVLDALAAQSWLAASGDRRRMLVSVAAFAAGQLDEPARIGAEIRHGRLFVARGWQPFGLDDLVAACRRAAARRDAESAAAACIAAWEGLSVRGPIALGRELAAAVLALEGLAAGPRVRCRLVLARSLGFQGSPEPARAELTRALQEAEGDAGLLREAELSLGRFEAGQGRTAEAAAHLEASLALAGSDALPASLALVELGNLAFHTGQLGLARQRYRDALGALGAEASGRFGAYPRGNLALIDASEGVPGAEAGLQAAIATFRALGDRRGEALYTLNLGILLQLRGRWEEAGSRFLSALELARQIGELEREGQLLLLLGGVGIALDDDARAAERLGSALAIAHTQGDRRFEAHARAALALIAAAAGDREGALAALDSAEAAFVAVDDPYGQADVLEKRSAIELEAGEPERALDTARRGRAAAGRSGRPDSQAVLASVEASALLAARGPAEAAALLAEALEAGRRAEVVQVEATALRDLALAAWRTGEPTEAAERIREARERARAAGPRIERSVTASGAELLAALGRTEEARAWLASLPPSSDRARQRAVARAEALLAAEERS